MADLIKFIKRWNSSTNQVDYIYPKTKWSAILNSPTTLAGYGITDAKIENGTITLGSNTITPITSHQSLSGYLQTSLKGAASGLAELDANGKVPSSQLPSYVDDVLEYSAFDYLPAPGETGKIYITTDTNKTYRWSGSAFVEISASLALGTTSSTAFRGDYGNTAYTHASQSGAALQSAVSEGLWKISMDKYGHVVDYNAVQKSDITTLGIPGSDTWRTVQCKGTSIGNNTLNLKQGSNITLTASNGEITIAATDTTYESKSAANGGTAVSLVTTGEKYAWNNKLSTAVTKLGTRTGDITIATLKSDLGLGSLAYSSATIPTNTNQLTNGAGFLTSSDINTAFLAPFLDTTFAPYSHSHSYLPLTGGNGLPEGSSDVTDNTEIITSYASNNGFADTNSVGTLYKRDAVHVYNYIKGKLDNVYQAKGSYAAANHTHNYLSSVSWGDIDNKPSSFTPSSHTHTKSEITDFPSSMPASDVYSWAKASTKPSYSALDISYGSNSNVSDALDELRTAGYITGINSTMVINALGYTPGTSNFTGYTSSNKLSTSYIQNDAGWSSFSGYSSSNKLSTNYINNVAGWTSNAGTVTSVSVKMNGSVKGTVSTSGTIDLGTVLTSHQSLSGCVKTADMSTAYLREFLDDTYAPYSHNHSKVSYYSSNPSSGAASGYLQFCYMAQSAYNGLGSSKRANTIYFLY